MIERACGVQQGQAMVTDTDLVSAISRYSNMEKDAVRDQRTRA